MENYINTVLTAVRKATKLTYEEIATKLGVTRKTIGRWRELDDTQIPLRIIEKLEKAFPEFITEKIYTRHSSIDLLRPEMLMALVQKDKLKIDDMVNRAANIFAHKLQIVLKSYAVFKHSRCGAYPTSYTLEIRKLDKLNKTVKAVLKVSMEENDYVLLVTKENVIVFGATLTDSAIIKAIKRIKGLFR